MRPCDISPAMARIAGSILHGSVAYVPSDHKTDWRDIAKLVLLGPKAQAILRPWLDREPTSYLFSPREVVAAKLERDRKRSVAQSINGHNGKHKRRRMPRERYDDESYCRAVQRICNRIDVPKWTPNQLRHTAATRLRGKHGIEAARVILATGPRQQLRFMRKEICRPPHESWRKWDNGQIVWAESPSDRRP